MTTKFKHLALGTRFSDPEILFKTYVKLSKSTAVELCKDEPIVCFNKPPIVGMWDDFEVVIRESYIETNHKYPMTPYNEGYQYYMTRPNRYGDNPYVEGTKEHNEWDDGYSDSDWDDSE